MKTPLEEVRALLGCQPHVRIERIDSASLPVLDCFLARIGEAEFRDLIGLTTQVKARREAEIHRQSMIGQTKSNRVAWLALAVASLSLLVALWAALK